ncbi:hypothetical protein B0H66DRAFT_533134 [Apodospora peruviana]|uniref:Uncharacterized protein n=1 Tax=Apodospora peruviana TaxID=516989 RepID=A0AAE0I5D8_9PEZI|nr:hypothetical protein B0H66DRAFT_533134 [Apodospora peruviana]
MENSGRQQQEQQAAGEGSPQQGFVLYACRFAFAFEERGHLQPELPSHDDSSAATSQGDQQNPPAPAAAVPTTNGYGQDQSPMLVDWLGQRDRDNLSINEVLLSDVVSRYARASFRLLFPLLG